MPDGAQFPSDIFDSPTITSLEEKHPWINVWFRVLVHTYPKKTKLDVQGCRRIKICERYQPVVCQPGSGDGSRGRLFQIMSNIFWIGCPSRWLIFRSNARLAFMIKTLDAFQEMFGEPDIKS